jgi:hypothetical protein
MKRLSLAAVSFGLALTALSQPADGAITAGADTRGAAAGGPRVVHVTSLADSGSGTLRAAVEGFGARFIVFDIAGVINLESDLHIRYPFITIAGQTAPRPGITITDGTLRVRTSNVLIQHIAVRPGPGPSAEVNGNRDGISVFTGAGASNVRIENVSISWAVDGGIDISGAGIRNVTVRNSIVAETLRNDGHPSGAHSMAMLLAEDAQGIAVTGNVFVSNAFRNPVMSQGVSAFVAYNWVVNPDQLAIHFYSTAGVNPLRASIVANRVDFGLDSDKNIPAVLIPADMKAKVPGVQIYLNNNTSPGGALSNTGSLPLQSSPPVVLLKPIAQPADVRESALRFAGKMPRQRDPIDARIASQISAHTTRIIDNPSQVGGLPAVAPVVAVAQVPSSPFSTSSVDGLWRIEAWLCALHLQVGGANIPECPRPLATYQAAIN